MGFNCWCCGIKCQHQGGGEAVMITTVKFALVRRRKQEGETPSSSRLATSLWHEEPNKDLPGLAEM